MRQVTLMSMLLVCIGILYSGDNSVFAANQSEHEDLSVDFGYMPPEWQTAICLPDDPFKSIVDKSGDLLYHYLRIKKVTEGFRTQVRIQIADDLVWEKQEPRNAIDGKHYAGQNQQQCSLSRCDTRKCKKNPYGHIFCPFHFL